MMRFHLFSFAITCQILSSFDTCNFWSSENYICNKIAHPFWQLFLHYLVKCVMPISVCVSVTCCSRSPVTHHRFLINMILHNCIYFVIDSMEIYNPHVWCDEAWIFCNSGLTISHVIAPVCCSAAQCYNCWHCDGYQLWQDSIHHSKASPVGYI